MPSPEWPDGPALGYIGRWLVTAWLVLMTAARSGLVAGGADLDMNGSKAQREWPGSGIDAHCRVAWSTAVALLETCVGTDCRLGSGRAHRAARRLGGSASAATVVSCSVRLNRFS